MIIQKNYKFYAAHRNELLTDKCSNLHGHRYGLRCFFDVQRTGAISTLFAEITALGFYLVRLEVQETDSSVVDYSRADWIADNRLFASKRTEAPGVPAG